jgi:hypothetical protein
MSWTTQLSITPVSVFDTILSSLTQQEGECLQLLYDTFQQYLINNPIKQFDRGSFLEEPLKEVYVIDNIRSSVNVAAHFSIKALLSNPDFSTVLDSNNLKRLKVLGLIQSNDDMHYGFTSLGIDFIEAMLQQESN